ncbi:hypothetical protein [Paraflavitalea speifideaquila]|uniref:hypothetical protein n=1 Tax=Paraflavitalea speifideaquila TaxID=3076558 RepID=UPI0028EE8493|nr:hypothetical protein [Paraflavitalea speifideiaquila]
MPINAVIIEDEPNNLENLQGLLANWCTGIQIVGTATTVDQAVQAIRTHRPNYYSWISNSMIVRVSMC